MLWEVTKMRIWDKKVKGMVKFISSLPEGAMNRRERRYKLFSRAEKKARRKERIQNAKMEKTSQQ